MICSSCGTDVNENNMFCPTCGTKIAHSVEEPQIEIQPEENIDVVANNDSSKADISEDTVTQKSASPSFNAENYGYNNNQPEQQGNQNPYNFPFFSPYGLHSIPDPGRDFAIASLVLGIVSYLLLCAFCFGWPSTFATTITGLVLGVKARNKSKQVGLTNGIAAAGIATSAIALALVSGICLMYLILFITGAEITSGEFMNELI